MAILLLIIKWIGILLLALLGLILLLLAVVLLSPIRYELKGSYLQKADLSVKARWLCSLISVRAAYHEELLTYQVKAFGKTVLSRKEQGDRATDQAEKEFRQAAQAGQDAMEEFLEEVVFQEDIFPDEPAAEAQGDRAEQAAPLTEKPLQKEPEPQMETTAQQTAASDQKTEKKAKKGGPSLADKVRSLCEKIKQIRGTGEKLQEFLGDEENKAALALMKRQFGKLLRHLLPKKFTARLRFGFEDPSTTGQVLGYLCMFYAVYGNNVSLEPDFEQKVLEGECDIKGRIRPGTLLWIVGKLFLNRRIRTWLFQLID